MRKYRILPVLLFNSEGQHAPQNTQTMPFSQLLQIRQQYFTQTVGRELNMLTYAVAGMEDCIGPFSRVPCSLRRGLRGFTGKQKCQT